MPDFQLEDARFDDPIENWVDFYSDARLRQRYLPSAGRIFCETVFTTKGSPEEAIRLLRGPWEWWHHGRSSKFHVNADGSTSQVLAPIWWHLTRVGVQIHPRRDLKETGGIRLPMSISRDFRGFASIDIYANPAAAGIIVRERYQGVENHTPVPAGMATRIHLRAEAGTLLFPFPKGTGFPGLWQLLEAGSP